MSLHILSFIVKVTIEKLHSEMVGYDNKRCSY